MSETFFFCRLSALQPCWLSGQQILVVPGRFTATFPTTALLPSAECPRVLCGTLMMSSVSHATLTLSRRRRERWVIYKSSYPKWGQGHKSLLYFSEKNVILFHNTVFKHVVIFCPLWPHNHSLTQPETHVFVLLRIWWKRSNHSSCLCTLSRT